MLPKDEKLWQEYVQNIQKGLNEPFQKQWAHFKSIYKNRTQNDPPAPAWFPDDGILKNSNLAKFIHKKGFKNFDQLRQWSIQKRADFWAETIQLLQIVFNKKPDTIAGNLDDVKNPGWLSDAQFNICESCFGSPEDNPAIVYASEINPQLQTISYKKLQQLVNRFANGLIENGFKKDDAIALYMPMNVECVVAYLAIVKAGCRVVSVADSFSADELKKRLKIANAKTVITVDAYSRAGKHIELYEKVKNAQPQKVILIEISGKSPLRPTDIFWKDFMSDSSKFEALTTGPEHITNILFSSGTTGEPKAIPWTQLTPIKCAMDGHFHQDIRQGDVVAWPTNIGWMMGPWLIYAALINKATIALYDGIPAGAAFFNFIAQAAVTMLGVIPSLVRNWRESTLLDMDSWQNIRLFSSTGEPSNREDYLWLMSRTRYKAPVIEYLGGTEIGGGHISGSVLQPACPATFSTAALGIDFVIMDEEDQAVQENESGELFLIPPSIGLSQNLLNREHDVVYYKNCPPGPAGQILRRHGDQMQQLAGGYYKAQGRADDTMNLGGIKISSLEIEQIARQHPALFECAAIAVQPSGEGKEELVLFVVQKTTIEKANLKKELAALISKKLNPLFKIYDLVIVETLPHTASNKLMRRTLRDSYQTG